MIKINEIFYSIQGESSWSGWPTVFIRTSGCNLRCTYCDTTYAYYEGEKKALDDILQVVSTFPSQYVCLTGGEPLLQPESFPLMTELCNRGYFVSVETSGSLSCEHVDARVKKIIDVKTPDSGAPNSFLVENLKFSGVKDEFKFVLCSENDFTWAEKFVEQHQLSQNYMVLYSPSFGKVDPKWLAEKILKEKSKARLQLQLHKYIWSPSQRGV